MKHWSRILTPDHKKMLPRVHGIRPEPKEGAAAFPEHLPDLIDTPWLQQEPVPYAARRGQVLVLCSGGLHSAWQNWDTVPRKGMGTSWAATGVNCGLPRNQREDVIAYHKALRPKLRPDRAHIVPDHSDWVFETDYEPKWPEMFLPTHSA